MWLFFGTVLMASLASFRSRILWILFGLCVGYWLVVDPEHMAAVVESALHQVPRLAQFVAAVLDDVLRRLVALST